MATDGNVSPALPLNRVLPNAPVSTDNAEETADRSLPSGTPSDHTLADRVAALTETSQEAEIDARMGLRGAEGHKPMPEDFADVLSAEGNSGDIFGSDVVGSPFVYGEDGSTRVPSSRERQESE